MSKSPYFTPLANENLDKLFRKILQPYQSKMIPFSTDESLQSGQSRDELSLQSLETSFRLQPELKVAVESLPLSIGHSIFLFRNETDPLMFKVFIAGTTLTPYAHGLFEFELLFQECPNTMPKVRFCTTGASQVTFNAYLPASGLIDVSHIQPDSSSPKSEAPEHLNITQLLLSLQSLFQTSRFLMGDEEKHWEKESEEGMREYKAYCNIIKYATIKHAMLEYLENPPVGLEDFICTYFCLKKDVILRECKEWQAEAQIDNGMYDNIAARTNPELAAELRNGAYFVSLNGLLDDLEQKMDKLKINENYAAMYGFKKDNSGAKTGTTIPF